jgi:hypothetical protein
MVTMDIVGSIRIPRAGAISAAILRIGIGLIYLWAFISQGFGVSYTNQVVNENGWGGLVLNLMIWFAAFYWGIGRWWRAHTAFLH